MQKRLALFCCFIGASIALHSQTLQDTAFERSWKQPWQLYRQVFGTSMALYNGSEYTASYPAIKGSAFLGDSVWYHSSIEYEGVFYPEVTLAFDLAANEVIIKG